jgi:hypothetical protein
MVSMLTTAEVAMAGPLSRRTLRIGHIIEGALLITYIYTPLPDVAPVRWFVRIALVPAIVATGVLMWKLPALRARTRRRAASAHV